MWYLNNEHGKSMINIVIKYNRYTDTYVLKPRVIILCNYFYQIGTVVSISSVFKININRIQYRVLHKT